MKRFCVWLLTASVLLTLAAFPASAEEPIREDEDRLLISLLGDCSVGDAYGSIKAKNSFHSMVQENGYAWPFSSVADLLAADDLTVANLEVVLTERNQHKDIMYPLRGLPEHARILLEGSVEAVNTVNNHSYDYGRAGYVDTLNTLDEYNIVHFGSMQYRREDGFDDIAVLDIKGFRVGLFGMSYPQDGDLKHIDELLLELKENRKCDIIIASMHWGREGFTGADKLTSVQLNLSRHLIEHGADVVYGHHPHVLQPMVFYQDKPVFFSTGNFIFGTISNDLDDHTAVFQLTFEKNGSDAVLRRVEVIPYMTGKKGDYRPVVPENQEDREKAFSILSPKRNISKFTPAPESFRTTGIVLFSETGGMITDE